MASKVSIFNLALYKLKQARITNPSQSVQLTDIYEDQRDIVLAAHPWNFAKFWASVAKDTALPDGHWQYAYAYTLPALPWCLRVYSLANDRAKFQVGGGRKLFTDEGSPLKFTYIGRVTDESRFSPGFMDALATKLAYEAGPKIAGISSKRAGKLWDEYLAKTAGARSTDGQEGVFLEIEASDYLDSRD